MQQSPQIKTILIVEDDRFIVEMYVRSLERAGFNVEWVMNGADAITRATHATFDLLLLDIMLPEKQGTEVLRQLRDETHDAIPDTRVIVLTNFDQDDESRAAMQARADGYLIKADITPKKLIEIIHQLKATSSHS